MPHDELAEHSVDEDYTKSLTVEAINPTAVAGKHIPEVFDVVSSFNARCQKPSEWAHKRGEESKNYTVELCWHAVELEVAQRSKGNFNVLHLKYWIDFVFASVVFKYANIVPKRTADPKLATLSLKHVATVVPSGKNIKNHAPQKAFQGFVGTNAY